MLPLSGNLFNEARHLRGLASALSTLAFTQDHGTRIYPQQHNNTPVATVVFPPSSFFIFFSLFHHLSSRKSLHYRATRNLHQNPFKTRLILYQSHPVSLLVLPSRCRTPLRPPNSSLPGTPPLTSVHRRTLVLQTLHQARRASVTCDV